MRRKINACIQTFPKAVRKDEEPREVQHVDKPREISARVNARPPAGDKVQIDVGAGGADISQELKLV